MASIDESDLQLVWNHLVQDSKYLTLSVFQATCLKVKPKALVRHYKTQESLVSAVEASWKNMVEAAQSIEDLQASY